MAGKYKVLCMDPLSNKMKLLIRNNLPENIEVIYCENDRDRETHIRGAHVLVSFTRGISKDWVEKAKQCIFIQKLGAGVNNIDIEAASAQNIPVANAKGLNATAVAEHTVMLMLAVFKHLVTAHNSIIYQDTWLKTGLRDQSYQLSHKKVGLVGLGSIGGEVLKLLRGFECQVSYYDIFRLPHEEEQSIGVKYMELDDLMRTSDVVSLHVPLNKQTYRLLGEQRLRMMKKTAILINTCRGGVIDEEALYEVLKSGHLIGAGLDVFETEPVSSSYKLAALPNVILTPHIGGGTNEAMELVAKKACENIQTVLGVGQGLNEIDVVNAGDLRV